MWKCSYQEVCELCHCNTYIAAVTNYVNKCIDLVAKSTELCFKMLLTVKPSLLLHFPCLYRNKQFLAVIFSYSLALLSKNFAHQIQP